MCLPRRTFAPLALASPSLRLSIVSSRLLTTPSNKKPQRPGSNSKPKGHKPRARSPATSPSSARSATAAAAAAVIPRPQSSSASPSREGKSLRPHLDPYELSRRLLELCDRGEVDLAVTTLQSTPRDAQNIKVWNTLIQQCMGAKRYRVAYSVFTDMKRRGFVPNVRTYATLMSGYAAIEDWGTFTKQLGYVHSVYGQLKQHLERSPNHLVDDPSSGGESRGGASFVLYVTALYISVLGKVGLHRRAFDVFHELDTDGPFAPDPKVYGSLLSVLADRMYSNSNTTGAGAGADDGAETIAKTLSDAKYVWRRHMRSLDKHPEQAVTPRSVEAMLKVLSRGGGPSDHKLMLDILRDFCGLPRPRESEGENTPSLNPSSPSGSPTPTLTSTPTPKVALNPWILSAVLDGCLDAGHPDLVVHYAQSVMDSSSQEEKISVLRPRHLYKLLRAHILLVKKEENLKGKPPPSSPARAETAAAWVEWMTTTVQQGQGQNDKTERGPEKNKTVLSKGVEQGGPRGAGLVYTSPYALELCYHCRDVPSALRIARAFLEGAAERGGEGGNGDDARRSLSSSSSSSGSMPTKAWMYFLWLAVEAPASPDEKRQCLELLSAAHRSVLDDWDESSASTPYEKRVNVTLARYILRLLRNDRDSDDSPSSPPDPGHDGTEKVDAAGGGRHGTWSDDLQRRAELILKKTS